MPEPKTRKRKKTFLVVQEGGSSCELYLHGHETARDARRDRIDCAKGAYRTSPVVEAPASLTAHPDFWAVADALIEATLNLAYPG